MHYAPFRFEDYPKIRRALEDFPVDFSTQRNSKNLRYFEGLARIDLVQGLETITCSFDISSDEINTSKYAPTELKALRYLLEQLNEADRIDKDIAFTTTKTLFEVNRTFRYFHQMYGGKRYVALCRDLIEKNMGGSLYPYMYEDLVTGIFSSYNKNASRDIDGLMEGIVTMLEETELSMITLKGIYSGIGGKCAANHYQDFVDLCLNSPLLRPSMKEFVVDGYVPSRYDGRRIYPKVDAKTLLSFDPEDIISLLEGLPGGMKDLVKEIFASFGDKANPEYIKAYLRNSSRDMSLLSEFPFAASLPADMKKEISRGKIFAPNAKKLDIIEAYEEAKDDPKTRQMILTACESYGQGELAKALGGKDFVLAGFSITELAALLPYADYDTPVMVPRLSGYLSRYGITYVHSEALERIFLNLHHEKYKELIRFALNKNCVIDKARRLCLAERFDLIGEMGFQEWKYHA